MEMIIYFLGAVLGMMVPYYLSQIAVCQRAALKELQAISAAVTRRDPDGQRVKELMEHAVPRVVKAQEELTKLRKMWIPETPRTETDDA